MDITEMGGKLDPLTFPRWGVTSHLARGVWVPIGVGGGRAPPALCSVRNCGSRGLTCAFGPTTATHLTARPDSAVEASRQGGPVCTSADGEVGGRNLTCPNPL